MIEHLVRKMVMYVSRDECASDEEFGEAVIQYLKEKTALLSSPGYTLINDLDRIYDNLIIFNENYDELKEHFAYFWTDDFKIIGDSEQVPDEKLREMIHRRTNRHLMNYLASALTLRELTTTIMKKYAGTDFDKEISSHVSEFFPIGLNATIKDFRNLILHSGSMEFMILSDATKEEITHTVILNRNKLLMKSDRWSPDAKKYIEEQDNDFNLEALCGEYYERVNKYYRWLFEKFVSEFQDDLQQFKNLYEIHTGKVLSYTFISLLNPEG